MLYDEKDHFLSVPPVYLLKDICGKDFGPIYIFIVNFKELPYTMD